MAGYILILLSGIVGGFLLGFACMLFIINNKCSASTREAIKRECGGPGYDR